MSAHQGGGDSARAMVPVARDMRHGTFAEHFRVHVAPCLERLCQVQGGFLALGVVDFKDAYDAILRAASSCGALHLSDAIFEDLESWICIQLAEAATSREDEVRETRLIAHRIGDECDAYFTAWAALIAASDDDGSWCWDYPA